MSTKEREIPFLHLFLEHQIPHFVPWFWLAALAWGESNFNPTALSKAGAWGIAQFMPSTWKEWGVGSPVNPEDAIPAMAAYLKFCRERCALVGKFEMRWAIAGYNMGVNRITQEMKWENVPETTRRWVESVERRAEFYRTTFPER